MPYGVPKRGRRFLCPHRATNGRPTHPPARQRAGANQHPIRQTRARYIKGYPPLQRSSDRVRPPTGSRGLRPGSAEKDAGKAPTLIPAIFPCHAPRPLPGMAGLLSGSFLRNGWKRKQKGRSLKGSGLRLSVIKKC